MVIDYLKSKCFWTVALLALGLANPFAGRVDAAYVTLGAFARYTETDSTDNFADFFEITNNSDAGVRITSFTITLPSNTIFDTNPGGQQNPAKDFMWVSGPSSGTFEVSPYPVPDGHTFITLKEFTGFDRNDSFVFTIDVDNTVPTSGMMSADNRRLVIGAEFAGATFSVTFSGDSFKNGTETLVGSFIVDPNNSLSAIVTLVGQAETVDLPSPAPVAAPEPASILLIGMGLAGLAGYRLRRRKMAQRTV